MDNHDGQTPSLFFPMHQSGQNVAAKKPPNPQCGTSDSHFGGVSINPFPLNSFSEEHGNDTLDNLINHGYLKEPEEWNVNTSSTSFASEANRNLSQFSPLAEVVYPPHSGCPQNKVESNLQKESFQRHEKHSEIRWIGTNLASSSQSNQTRQSHNSMSNSTTRVSISQRKFKADSENNDLPGYQGRPLKNSRIPQQKTAVVLRGNVSMTVPRLPYGMDLGPTEILLRRRLLSLAEAVVTNDQELVLKVASLVRNDSNPIGDVMQRLAHYSLQALQVRQEGKGAQVSTYLGRPPPQIYSRIMHLFTQKQPALNLGYLIAAEEIFHVCKTEPVVHVIDFGHWPQSWHHLLQRISFYPNTCRKICLTMVRLVSNGSRETRHPSGPDPELEQKGQELIELASVLGISLQFQVIHSSIRTLQLSEIRNNSSEALVVLCGVVLAQLTDSTVMRSNPRDTFLKMLHKANPTIVLSLEFDYDLNNSFFLARFNQMLSFFSIVFDTMDASFQKQTDQWIIEKVIAGRELMNIVSCEGLDRFLRFETFAQRCERFIKAGFLMKRVDPKLVTMLQHAADNLCEGYTLRCDDGAMHVDWKTQPFMILATWCPQ